MRYHNLIPSLVDWNKIKSFWCPYNYSSRNMINARFSSKYFPRMYFDQIVVILMIRDDGEQFNLTWIHEVYWLFHNLHLYPVIKDKTYSLEIRTATMTDVFQLPRLLWFQFNELHPWNSCRIVRTPPYMPHAGTIIEFPTELQTEWYGSRGSNTIIAAYSYKDYSTYRKMVSGSRPTAIVQFH